MARGSTECDPDRLKLLVDDRLSPEDTFGLEQHLEECPPCRNTLDNLFGSDQCLQAVRVFLDDESPSVFKQPPHTIESLHFLAPSDWPDSMGRLGTYEVKGILGRGGMGIVLKAFDPALNRNVAVKVLSASLAATGAARARFLREARAAAAVVHEHVVGVFAVAEAAGLPFLVMEYVSGHRSRTVWTVTAPLPSPRSFESACRRPPASPLPMPRGSSTAMSSLPISSWRTVSNECG